MAVAIIAASSTHTTLTPYLAIPLVIIGLGLGYLRRSRRR